MMAQLQRIAGSLKGILQESRDATTCGVPWLIALVLGAALAHAQQGVPSDADGTPRATVHGVVLNTATNEPLARALVRRAGEGSAGALTDSEGRYEIEDVVTGPQLFEVIKPGFLDATAEAAAAWGSDAREYAHTVMVGAEMPDVTFRMEPANAIRGVVQLSTGDAAEGIEINLLRQTVLSGRFTWQTASTMKTNAEGAYRFGNLPDGVYAIYNSPAMENDTPAAPLDLKQAPAERRGYPSEFYPGARDFSGAARIRLREGEQAEANLALALEPFHAVAAMVSVPADAAGQTFSPDRPGTMVSAVVVDGQGRQLPYAAQYDQNAHSVQALLPDGNYALLVTAGRPGVPPRRARMSGSAREGGLYTGAVEFSVNGHSVTDLRIGLAGAERNVLQVNVERSGTNAHPPSAAADAHEVVLTIGQTGSAVSDGVVSTLAMGPLDGSIDTMFASPGRYWVHANLSDKHYCASSLMAGGSNLAREPLTLGTSGSSVPLTLNVRDDCAKLTLGLPATAAALGAGEESFYTVYAVPDFDSTEDVIPQTLRPSSGGKITLEGLTPGSYHVYAFDKPVALAYREKAVMDAVPTHGQAIDLAPGQAASLIVEIAQ